MAEHVEEATGQRVVVSKKSSKRKRKREQKESSVGDPPLINLENEDGPLSKKAKKWKNKTRVLVLSARGVTYRSRHLLNDVKALLPHSRTDSKIERSEGMSSVVELCEMKNCTKCIFFEMRKKKDLYMWVAQVPNGPSAKFLVENVHTMDELKMAGNCLLGSRPFLSFDKNFEESPHYSMIKELFINVFGTPYYHPKSKPFIDHVFHFGFLDNHIWFRNYQIVEDGKSMSEIGPRFTLNLIKIFAGGLGGITLYENPKYQTPNAYRQMVKHLMAEKRLSKLSTKRKSVKTKKKFEKGMKVDPLEAVFKTSKK